VSKRPEVTEWEVIIREDGVDDDDDSNNKSNNNIYAQKYWKAKIHWLSTARVTCENEGDTNNNICD
jgi:hypothetical protein